MVTDSCEAETLRPAGCGTRSVGSLLDAILIGGVDAGLASTVFLVPLVMGGRSALGQLVLVVFVLWTAACWCLRQCATSKAWIRTPGSLLLAAAVALAVVQIVPLPGSLLATLSPSHCETLPLWSASGDEAAALGTWSTLSLAPVDTRKGVVLLLCFAMLFVVTAQRVRRVEDVERLLRWIALSTLLMAVFGLVQYLSSNGKYFWFYEHPFRHTNSMVVGSFANRNHFAQFIALGIGPLIWWTASLVAGHRRRHSARRRSSSTGKYDVKIALWAIACAICVVAALMSTSRGGTLALAGAVSVCLLILYRAALIGRKAAFGVVGIGLFVAVFLAIHGYDAVATRLDDFASIDELNNGRRLELWQADAGAIRDYPLAGTGLGSHREVCPIYLQNDRTAEQIEYTHAENGYVQVALEGGLSGLLLALTAVGLCIYWCVSLLRRRPPTRVLICVAALAATLAASFIHSMTDFVWYIPGCMVAVVISAACASRLWVLGNDEARGAGSEVRHSSFVLRHCLGWLAATVVLILIAPMMIENRLAAARAAPHWYRYLALDKDSHKLDDPAAYPAAISEMADALSKVLEFQPDHARAHAAKARLHVEWFNLPQNAEVVPIGVRQVREVVLASQFGSADEMNAWLTTAFGDRRLHLTAALHHARRAVTLCPLLGEGYIRLTDLSFLEGAGGLDRDACFDQAFRVRPAIKGEVFLVAGQDAFLEGRPDVAIQYWQQAAQAGPVYQFKLVELLMPQVPIEIILAIVQPDVSMLERIRFLCRKMQRQDSLATVDRQLAEKAQREAHLSKGVAAASSWLVAGRAHVRLGQLPQAIFCLQNAVRNNPTLFEARLELGSHLLGARRFDEALVHLSWCAQRQPRNATLQAQRKAAVDGQLRVTQLPEPGSGVRLQ
ncbi:MAG: O-antigen ligase family protein [Candidatus Nealsonbacteria bacterium]|nr:O-antigen ligase family protein [Candidatus Nealsonbacteria bacterium]